MPSEIAQKIVDQILGDEKSKAIDSVNDALAAASYDAIQARKVEFAKSMGFELDDTAQDAADEIADNLPDGTEAPETVEVDGRKPEDPPEAEKEEPVVDATPSSVDPTEEPNDETDS